MTSSGIDAYQLPTELTSAFTEVQQFDTIDSTNAEALRQLQAGKTGSFLLLAHTQTAGRGRRGRPWHSPPGAGIYLTLVRPFARSGGELQALSLVTALSVQEALQHCGVANIRLKWPNDLLVDKKKLGGILLELKSAATARYVVFGVGINLKLPAEIRSAINQPATDLHSLSHQGVDKSTVLAAVLQALLGNLQVFEQSAFQPFQARWNALDHYRDQDIVLQVGDHRKIGKSLGVDDTGALLLQTAAGVEKIGGGEIFPSLSPAPAGSQEQT